MAVGVAHVVEALVVAPKDVADAGTEAGNSEAGGRRQVSGGRGDVG